MSISSPPACPLGVTHDTLSALRDGFLEQEERERLDTHVAGCAACTARLADFDVLAQVLQSQRVPVPDARLWESVARTVSQPSRRPRLRLPRGLPKPSRQAWGALGAAAAILLIVTAFARLLTRPTVEQPTHPLVWHEVTLPADFTAKDAYTSIGLAAGGQTAYACVFTFNQFPQASFLWVTRDGGAHWQHASKVLVSDAPQTCTVLPDQDDPNIVVANYMEMAPKNVPRTLPAEQVYASLDGGANWRELPAGQSIVKVATRQGVTYARREDFTAQDADPRLAVSSDQLHSWRTLDDELVATGQHVTDFWLDPASSDILAMTDQGKVYTSSDGNGHWAELHPPTALSVFAARSASAGGAPQICGAQTDAVASTSSTQGTAFCSRDGGTTWQLLPSLSKANACSAACVKDARIVGICADGALLVRIPTATGTSGGVQSAVVYRVTPGETNWESLGALQVGSTKVDVLMAPGLAAGTGTDALWAFSDGVSVIDGPQGLAGLGLDSPEARVYTAIYPPNAQPQAAVTPMPSATATPLPTLPLTWKATGLPSGATDLVNPTGLVVAPTDGNTAYWCGVTRMTSPAVQVSVKVWATRDGGANWPAPAILPSRVESMPADAQFQECALQVDTLVPTTALATLTYNGPGNGAGFSYAADYATFNGGKSWHQVTVEPGALYPQYQQLASLGSTIYALRWVKSSAPPDGTSPFKYHVYASTDQMRTWQRADGAIADGVQRFWIDPASGAMLEETGTPEGDGLVRLYASGDRGATWMQVTAPAFDTAWAQATQSGVWRICTATLRFTVSGSGDSLYCSTDGGKTWTTRPDFPAASSPGQEYWIGLADDGAVLTVVAYPPNAQAAQAQQFTLYRLTANAVQWQSLGAVGGWGVSYASAPSNGLLVVLDAQQRILTADYPG